MNELSPIQARVLGCLIEKKETTPDQYPLTVNALRTACNQKSSRDPVTAYTEGEVGRAVRELESMGLAREEWGARTQRYEHQAGKAWNLHSPALALLATLMLRGPQTLGELRTHAQRLHEFADLDDVQFALGRLMERDPPLVAALPRQPGQKEGRFAHLLCGMPEAVPAGRETRNTVRPAEVAGPESEAVLQRIEQLESDIADLRRRLEVLEDAGSSRPEGG